MIKKNYVCGILTLLFANPVYAALDCKQQPTCESLGYSKSGAENCPADGVIACPFDMSYKKCVISAAQEEPIDCTKFGFTLTDKSSYCDNILACPADEKYTICVGNDCSDYPLSSCPSNAECSKCGLTDNPKYKIDSCKNEDYVNTGTSCEPAYNRCCELSYHLNDRYSDAAYCDEDKSGDNGSESISCSEVEIYLTSGQKKTCYQCEGYGCSDRGSCSSFQVCGSRCEKPVENCEAAGYLSQHKGSTYNCSTTKVDLISGQTAQCYYNCKLKPTSCTDAGYFSSTSSCKCGVYQINVALRNGTTAKCYRCQTCDFFYGCDDCLERCAESCNMNIQNCAGYDQCSGACFSDYDDC